MGVYIKGMKMPERCWDCDLCYDSFYCKGLEVQFSDREDSEPSERRLSDCPLVPVPPHGRLIDADALEQDAQKRLLMCNKNNNQFQKPYEVMRAIALAPTIIPAEEGNGDVE